jgi:hypothetical protein
MLMRTPYRWVRPTLADKVPAGDGWIHELKHDGFRILAFRDGDTVRLWSRNGRELVRRVVGRLLGGAPEGDIGRGEHGRDALGAC